MQQTNCGLLRFHNKNAPLCHIIVPTHQIKRMSLWHHSKGFHFLHKNFLGGNYCMSKLMETWVSIGNYCICLFQLQQTTVNSHDVSGCKHAKHPANIKIKCSSGVAHNISSGVANNSLRGVAHNISSGVAHNISSGVANNSLGGVAHNNLSGGIHNSSRGVRHSSSSGVAHIISSGVAHNSSCGVSHNS